jgi:alpha-glucosidase
VLPSTGWYDFWTGAKIPAQPVRVSPTLAGLPVYVRAGSILPMAPLVQSTSETPNGPLTLRVYVGEQCAGELYQDDGKTYAYQHGDFLRMKFTCEKSADGLVLKISPHEGAYPAWWKNIRVEIYGWSPKQGKILVNREPVSSPIDHQDQGIWITIADDGKGAEVEIE